MVFNDLYDGFFGTRRPNRSNYQMTVSELEELRRKADRYEAISSENETLRLENRKLKDVLEELKEDGRKLKEVQEEAEEFYKALLRVRADFDNYKKRTERNKADYKIYALESILKKLLRHNEDLERGVNIVNTLEIPESTKKGFELIFTNFQKLLKEEGLEPMECEGDQFDPYKHEAMMVEENDELPENTILEEFDKGYFFNNKILRPAKVKLSKQSKNQIQSINKIKERSE